MTQHTQGEWIYHSEDNEVIGSDGYIVAQNVGEIDGPLIAAAPQTAAERDQLEEINNGLHVQISRQEQTVLDLKAINAKLLEALKFSVPALARDIKNQEPSATASQEYNARYNAKKAHIEFVKAAIAAATVNPPKGWDEVEGGAEKASIIIAVDELGDYKTGSLPASLSVKDIEAVIGFPANVQDDPWKTKHSWGFTVNRKRAAIWDYKGSRWSTYDPDNVLPGLFADILAKK